MQKEEKNTLLIAGAAAVILLIMLQPNKIFKAAMALVAGFEGFEPHPYWDVSRYSWGYGTPAPGPTGTITRAQALQDLAAYNLSNYDYLHKLIAVPLNVNQWAALLSFAYNLGKGNADNLVPNINAQNWDALGIQWAKYNKKKLPDGTYVVDPDLVARRAKEWQLFSTGMA